VLASPPYSFALGYDELHRVMWKSYPDGTRVDYVHDDPSVPYSKGRLTRVTDSSGWTTFAFDARGRVIRQARAIDGVVYTNGTSYDPADRVVGETYPDASAVAYQYDVDGFLGRVSMGGSDYALLTGYNALGQVGSIASPASSTAFAYNDTGNNRLRSVQVTARGARVLDLAYEYEPNRRIKKLTDGLDPGLTFDFGYDGLSRLTSATSSRYGQLSYSYDTIGNFISKEGVAYTAYDPVKVHAVRTTSDGRSYGYDPNGNMTADGSRTLLYDWENRPTVVTSGSTTSLFTYTAGGERVKRQVKVGTTVTSTSVYVGRLYECTNGVCTKHVFAGDTRIASLEDGGAVRYYHGDHLDSTRVVTDAAGFVLERIAYKPYGDGDSPPTNGTRYRYTSKERDAETGLYFYGARYYDPRLGRFISPDPPQMRPGEPSSLNRYAYVNNNPVRFNDPSGNEGEDPQVPLSPSDYKMPTASEVADRVAASFIGRFVEGQRAELRAQAQMFVSGEIVNPRRMLVGTYDFTLRSLRVGSNTAAGMASDEPLSTTIGVVTDVRDGAALASMLMGVGVALGPKGAPDLPSDALVCRAGTCGRDNFLNGTGVRVGPDGRLYRVSVSAGGTDKELGATFPHKQMGVTKVGQVEAAGGKLTHTPTAANPYHHDLDGLTADQLVELFKDVQRNPNPAPRPDVPR
jgi:RHS repeat-associated protein